MRKGSEPILPVASWGHASARFPNPFLLGSGSPSASWGRLTVSWSQVRTGPCWLGPIRLRLALELVRGR